MCCSTRHKGRNQVHVSCRTRTTTTLITMRLANKIGAGAFDSIKASAEAILEIN